MERTPAQKMGIKENTRVFFINPNEEAINNMLFPNLDIANELVGEFDYIHLFHMKQWAATFKQKADKKNGR